ncbi:hypothetical protein GUJ93_ZPchr0010g7686 [Zizania palustris]|uniref:Uncharacterized protein n=1 Tax=Zizania palustris TaxID=103762 RepID=A0A8J5WEA7_ZIZPA|nr:hypothetical protein GUJ93_ZPchr0010g7686 [Zizania palustris]
MPALRAPSRSSSRSPLEAGAQGPPQAMMPSTGFEDKVSAKPYSPSCGTSLGQGLRSYLHASSAEVQQLLVASVTRRLRKYSAHATYALQCHAAEHQGLSLDTPLGWRLAWLLVDQHNAMNEKHANRGGDGRIQVKEESFDGGAVMQKMVVAQRLEKRRHTKVENNMGMNSNV